MTGYIVALLTGAARQERALSNQKSRKLKKLLDIEPSLTPEVVEIARWVADYYAAPLGEVMRAALPAGINTSIMQVVSITPKGRAALESESVPPAVAGGSVKTGPRTKRFRCSPPKAKPR